MAAATLSGAAATSTAAPTRPMLVVGDDAAALVRRLGVADVRSVDGFAVADLTAGQVRRLTERHLHVLPDSPVTLDAKDPASASEKSKDDPTGHRTEPRISVAEQTGASDLAHRGSGVTIAVLDSGVDEVPALAGRVSHGPDFTQEGLGDRYGHGTFVAGLAAGDGRAADGTATPLVGVAPAARILSVKVADGAGRSSVGQLVLGLAWVLQRDDVDVVNLSLSSEVQTSYHFNPINALVEALWLSGTPVVASAGNNGSTVNTAPGNDPYVITVGSLHDANTVTGTDDRLSPYSNTGRTVDGYLKPELVATGQHVQGPLPAESRLAQRQRALGLPAGYGQLSGTSMAAAVGSGAVAVLLSAHPEWSPDQVKSALVHTNSRQLDALRLPAALDSDVRGSVNGKARPSVALAAAYAQLFHSPPTTDYAAVDFAAVDWSAVPWSTATWTSATWTSATWTNATWTNATWTDATWTTATWADATWASATWATSATIDDRASAK